MKKVLVSDYDGTFYINDNDIKKNKLAVNEFRKNGNIFVIATGRSYQDFKEKKDKYNLSYDYVILNHGVTILDQYDNVLFSFPPIDSKIINNIKKQLRLEKSINSFCCSELESRVDFYDSNLTKINILYNSRDDAIEVNRLINNNYSKYVNSYCLNSNSIEIVSSKANKSNAIAFLLKKINIPLNNVYTIGNGYSDINMIKDYNGYIIKNSINELAQYALKEFESVSELINEIM